MKVVAYVPVLHEGYRSFFEKHRTQELFLIGPELLQEFPWLAKEIRQIDSSVMKQVITALNIFEKISILNVSEANSLNSSSETIVLADEDISHSIAEKYFPQAQVTFDPVFLRWDKNNSVKDQHITADSSVSKKDFIEKIIVDTKKEAEKSSDMWRQVGAALIKDQQVVNIVHNRHLPSAHTPYTYGDPRNNFHKGDHIEISSAIHAEAQLIAQAAKEGVATNGLDMYVTTFPCPPCAKLIAQAGIKNLYFSEGYAVLDGQTILKSGSVRIVCVHEG